MRIAHAAALAAALALAAAAPAQAQKEYGPGVTDSEIKLGQTMPYSGPAAAYGTLGRLQTAYFNMINEAGGINGRKIKLISLDDAYSPPRTVEQTRRLVEEEQVFLIFGSLGTAPNAAIAKYLNAKKVPQLFIATGGAKWNDPKGLPWTIAGMQNYATESRIYANYVKTNLPQAKIGILYQNDDFGKDFLHGIKDGLGDAGAKMIVAEHSYELTDATVDSQIHALKASGADVFFNMTTPKFAVQAIRRAAEIGWRPLQIVHSGNATVNAVLQPAGLENAKGMITATAYKDPSDPQWADDPGVKRYLDFMKKWYPAGNPEDINNVTGYIDVQLITLVLQRAGDKLTRENVMKVAGTLEAPLDMLLPGITIQLSNESFSLYRKLHLQRFDGTRWVLFGEPVAE